MFAKTRGEVYYFDTEEEAAKFAEGGWKNISSPEVFAQQFYQDKGKDYYSEQEMFENYDQVKDDIDFIEYYMPKYGTNTLKIPEDVAKLHPDYVYKDARRS